jgi:hypothetical protein
MMYNFLGKLFGTEKALGGIVDGVTNGLDALVYTDEEKAADAAANRAEARQMVVRWMEATQGQNLARRLIALSITGVWLGMYVVSVLSAMAGVFLGTEAAQKAAEVGKIAKGASADMNSAVMLILAFYFAAPHMSNISKAVTDKFSKKV